MVVDLNGSGGGSVTGTAPCSGTVNRGCGWSIPDASAVTLTATASAGSVFTGWSGVCTGTGTTCSFTAFAGALAVANFRAAPAPVLQYYHLDTLGSVRAVTDASGAVVERHDYRPFGEDNAPLPAPGANPARFLGQPRDQTKLDYFGARYLDMHTGRFTGVDPILSPAALTDPQKFNRYAYAENNPLRFSDITGMDDGLVLTDTERPNHWDTGLAQGFDLDARANAVCTDWDDMCGYRGFDNFVTDFYNQPDQVGVEVTYSDGHTETTYGPSAKAIAASLPEGTRAAVEKALADASSPVPVGYGLYGFILPGGFRESGFEGVTYTDGSEGTVPYIPGPWTTPEAAGHAYPYYPKADLSGTTKILAGVDFDLHVHPYAYDTNPPGTWQRGPSPADLVENPGVLKIMVGPNRYEQQVYFYDGVAGSRPVSMSLNEFLRTVK